MPQRSGRIEVILHSTRGEAAAFLGFLFGRYGAARVRAWLFAGDRDGVRSFAAVFGKTLGTLHTRPSGRLRRLNVTTRPASRAGCVVAVCRLRTVGVPGQSRLTLAEVALRSDTLIARFLADDGPPGVSVAIVRDGDTLVAGGSGLADRDRKIAATADTSYRIGSISRQFTAAMAMRLVYQGKIAPADAVGRRLPELPSRWRSVTVLQLLNHTSGIRDYTELGDRWREHWQKALSPAQILALVANDRMDFAPGSKRQCSNTGVEGA